MSKPIKASLLCYLVTSLLALTAPPALAQSVGLSIYPPLVQINIKPGKTITQAFNIAYSGPRQRTFVARIVPFTSRDTLSIPTLEFNQHPSWLTYFRLGNSRIALDQPFTLEPGQEDQLIVSLKVPNHAPEADLYAAIVLSSIAPAINTGNPQIEAGIAGLMIVSTTNSYPPTNNTSISAFKPATTPLFTLPGPIYVFDNLSAIAFSATAANSGPHARLIEGNFTVTGATGYWNLPLTESYLLAQSQKALTASGSSSLTYRPQITHLGRAVAALNLSGDRPVSSTLTIILLPIKAGVSTLLAIGIIYFVIRTTNKKPKQPRPIEGSEPKKVRNLQSSTTLPNHPTIKPSNH